MKTDLTIGNQRRLTCEGTQQFRTGPSRKRNGFRKKTSIGVRKGAADANKELLDAICSRITIIFAQNQCQKILSQVIFICLIVNLSDYETREDPTMKKMCNRWLEVTGNPIMSLDKKSKSSHLVPVVWYGVV